MQNDDSNDNLNTEGNSGSVTPLGDDSVESLTAKPSPNLHKNPEKTEDNTLDNDSDIDDSADTSQPKKKTIFGFYKKDKSNTGTEQQSNEADDEVDNTDDEDDLSDLENVRVANMNDDLDIIELEPVSSELGALSDDEYSDADLTHVPVKSAAELSRDELLFSMLRRDAASVNETRAARIRTRFLLLIIVLLIILVLILIAVTAQYPKTVYIPTKDNAAICEVTPENNPYLTDLSIAEFGRDGILSLYSINFTNWQSETDRVFDEFFTSDGKIRTIQALKDSGLIAYVDNNALSLRANSTQTSHVESKGFFPDGTPYWTVTFPFVVEVYSGREKEPIQVRQYVATTRVVVDRASAQNPKGLGIDAVTLFEPKR